MSMRYEAGPTMTVGELIAVLQKHPATALVYTEGCDCIGNAREVLTEPDSDGRDAVLISRYVWSVGYASTVVDSATFTLRGEHESKGIGTA